MGSCREQSSEPSSDRSSVRGGEMGRTRLDAHEPLKKESRAGCDVKLPKAGNSCVSPREAREGTYESEKL